MGAVGRAPCAVALLVAGQVPMATNGMLTYAKKSLGSKLSFFFTCIICSESQHISVLKYILLLLLSFTSKMPTPDTCVHRIKVQIEVEMIP